MHQGDGFEQEVLEKASFIVKMTGLPGQFRLLESALCYLITLEVM